MKEPTTKVNNEGESAKQAMGDTGDITAANPPSPQPQASTHKAPHDIQNQEVSFSLSLK